MKADTRALMGETFSRIVEKQAYMFAEAQPASELPAPTGDWREARISFRGPMEGSFALALPARMQLEVAANFMGREPDDPEVARRLDDSFKELINVVCGHLLTALAGEDPVFDLSMPQVAELTPAQVAALAAAPDCLAFLVDEHPALLSVHLGEERP